jgi:hypothetical protein
MINNFDTKIQALIEERQNILFEIERTIFTKRYGLSINHKEIFSAQSIAMIYSIWEGFIQDAFAIYIEEINNEVNNFYGLSDKILVHCMENKFKQFHSYPVMTDNRKISFLNDLKAFYDFDTPQEINRNVNTESNVGFDVLNKLLIRFSLEEFPPHWDIYTHPNPNLKEMMFNLLKLRNEVAHKGSLAYKIDQETYIRYKDLVVNLMYEIRQRMINGLQDETFKKSV